MPYWFKSSKSIGASSCVEVKFVDGVVLIRDSKFTRDPNNDPACQPIISVPVYSWNTFLKNISGQSVAAISGAPAIVQHADGGASLRCRRTGVTLAYTKAEWDAFTSGVLIGEFEPR